MKHYITVLLMVFVNWILSIICQFCRRKNFENVLSTFRFYLTTLNKEDNATFYIVENYGSNIIKLFGKVTLTISLAISKKIWHCADNKDKA